MSPFVRQWWKRPPSNALLKHPIRSKLGIIAALGLTGHSPLPTNSPAVTDTVEIGISKLWDEVFRILEFSPWPVTHYGFGHATMESIALRLSIPG